MHNTEAGVRGPASMVPYEGSFIKHQGDKKRMKSNQALREYRLAALRAALGAS